MIRVGTAGWHYEDWNGVVYPRPRPRGFDPLETLSRLFDAIEINVTFYRVPDPSMTRTWVRRVASNPDFRFTAKLPRSFTHVRAVKAGRTEGYEGTSGDYEDDARARQGATRAVDPDEEERRFRDAMAPLLEAGRLGAVLIQFPQSFHAGPEEAAYLDELLDRFSGLPLVAEFRHAGWGREESVERLRRLGVGFCNIDQPRLGSTLGPTSHVTGPVAYVRLHGRNAAEWFRGADGDRAGAGGASGGAGRPGETGRSDAFARAYRADRPGSGGRTVLSDGSRRPSGSARRYDYLYSESELAPWIGAIRRISEEGADTYVITNNHFRGKAAVNALVEVPDPLLGLYPELASIAKPPANRLPF